MPCYPHCFGASIHSAVHHRSCLKTCIKLKQQKLYCPLIWYCHFPTAYLPRIAMLTSQHHLCLPIWEVSKISHKVRWRKPCGKASTCGACRAPCLHSMLDAKCGKRGTMAQEKQNFPLLRSVTQPLMPTDLNNPSLTSSPPWNGLTVRPGRDLLLPWACHLHPWKVAPDQEPCFTQI